MSEPTRIVCFGELLVRLSGADGEQLLQSPSLDVHFGGAEANVAVSLARFGHDAAMISIVPPNALGMAAVAELRRHGVDTRGIATGPGRMGLYFLTPGAVSRPSAVLYDRAGSAFAQAATTTIDWRAALRDARWLHLSGIASALGENAAAANQRAADAALELGVAVSFDGNYREQLWAASGGDAKRLLLGMLATAQLAFVDDRDITLLLGSTRRSGDVTYEQGKGIITAIDQVGGYPEYRGEPYPDVDRDGMPDSWETTHGIDAHNAADAAADLNGDGYTNIEEFLNGLDPRAPQRSWPTPRTYKDLFNPDGEFLKKQL